MVHDDNEVSIRDDDLRFEARLLLSKINIEIAQVGCVNIPVEIERDRS